MRTSNCLIGIILSFSALSFTLWAQSPPQSVADTLPPPLPLDASGKPVAAPKSNLERPDFSRAIYVDAVGPTLKSSTSIRKLVQDCRELGFNTIVAQVRCYGDAYYQSQVVPRAADLKEDFDPLKLLLDEARSGAPAIKVHAMVSALRVAMKDQQLPPKHVLLDHRDWLTKTNDGSEEVGDNKNEYWLDPGVVEVQDHIALVTAEIVRNYAVDGIQLERVRLPDVTLRAGYNPKALERFKAEKGVSAVPEPKDPIWIEWRRNQITEIVRKTREAVKAARPEVEFSASAVTYGNPPKDREQFLNNTTPGAFALCDWQGWAEQGLVDSIALMDYKAAETRAGDFEGWMNFALANKGKAKATVVVGGWLNNSKLTAAMMLLPIFDPRADGVGLYSYHAPAAPPETAETAFSVIKAVLYKENVERRAAKLVDALSKPLTTEHALALARLNQIAGIVAGGASSAAAGSATTSLPSLAESQTKTGRSELPSLGAAQTAATKMPVLGEAATQPTTTGAPPKDQTLPPLRIAVQQAQPPTLPSLGTAATTPAAASTLPTLDQPTVQAPLPPTTPALPPLAQPGAPTQQQPTLPGPSQAATVQPAATPPTLPLLSDAPVATPDVSGAAPTLPLLTPSAPATQAATSPPALSQATLSQPQELPVATPAPTPALPQLSAPGLTPPPAESPTLPPAAPTSPATGLAEKFAKMGIPTEETRGSIMIPGSTGESNFGAAATPAAPAVPTFVAPSVLSPTPSVPTPPPVNVMALMPTPVSLDRSNTKDSPFIKATPLTGPRNYAPAPTPQTASPAAGLGGNAELIVLKNGQQFVGQVVERGTTTWRIQLPNGSKIAIPANKVAQTRPVVSTSQ
ncbi:MAG: family 10 glycosylhydrolase [Candidatus Sumerlaeaceae bacterium]|nr:family 10 glycosylhydrolase [Candidatus Sumerlaeaceae bacterium]